MAKYYAVRKGRQTGIYMTWAEAEAQVKGFSGAEYKSFPTEAEACAYMNGENSVKKETASKTVAKTTKGKVILRPFTPDETLEEYYEVHSDGGARGGNPGFGGYGYVVVDKNHKIVEEGYGYGWDMTNNQAELLGAITGIKAVEMVQKSENAKVYFITDSTYVYAGFAKDFPDQPRFEKWANNGWKNATNKVPENLELVQELYTLGKKHDVECIPRKYEEGKRNYLPFAHGDKKLADGKFENPYNKICDRLANIGIVDALKHAPAEDSPVRLIANGENVLEKVDVEYKDEEIVTYEQKAPFYVADLDEQRHGRVLDVDGKEAKVN